MRNDKRLGGSLRPLTLNAMDDSRDSDGMLGRVARSACRNERSLGGACPTKSSFAVEKRERKRGLFLSRCTRCSRSSSSNLLGAGRCRRWESWSRSSLLSRKAPNSSFSQLVEFEKVNRERNFGSTRALDPPLARQDQQCLTWIVRILLRGPDEEEDLETKVSLSQVDRMDPWARLRKARQLGGRP